MGKILVIEDDELLAKALVGALKDAGYEVVAAATGEEGLEKARSGKPDLIYLDIMLPGISGYDVLTTLRAEPEHINTPIVMLTNLGQMSEINKALDIGATDYVIKANMDLEKIVELTKTKYLVNAV